MIINFGKRPKIVIEFKDAKGEVIYFFEKEVTLELNNLVTEGEKKYSINASVNSKSKNIDLANINTTEMAVNKALYVVENYLGDKEICKIRKALTSIGEQNGMEAMLLTIYDNEIVPKMAAYSEVIFEEENIKAAKAEEELKNEKK